MSKEIGIDYRLIPNIKCRYLGANHDNCDYEHEHLCDMGIGGKACLLLQGKPCSDEQSGGDASE